MLSCVYLGEDDHVVYTADKVTFITDKLVGGD